MAEKPLSFVPVLPFPAMGTVWRLYQIASGDRKWRSQGEHSHHLETANLTARHRQTG